eukprot:g1067.t1
MALQADAVVKMVHAVQFCNVEDVAQALQQAEKGKAREQLASCVADNGMPVLVLAARRGSVEICKTLMNAGADINCSDRLLLRTALMVAAKLGWTKIVQLLLHAGADVQRVDQEERVALHWAAIGGNEDAVKVIASHPACNVDALDASGYTPLLYASEHGSHACVKALLTLGAESSQERLNNLGYSAVMLSEWYGKTEVVELLRESGGGQRSVDKDEGAGTDDAHMSAAEK